MAVQIIVVSLMLVQVMMVYSEEPCYCVTKALCKETYYMSVTEMGCDNSDHVCCARQTVTSLPLSCGNMTLGNVSEISWMTSVIRKDVNLGSAAFIHPGIVVTAAHIVYSVQLSDLSVRVQGEDHIVTQVLVHPKFRARLLHYDIALLVLENSSKFGTACLPEQGDIILENKCIFASMKQFNDLQLSEMTVMSRVSCQNALTLYTAMGPLYHLHNSFMCGFENVPHDYVTKGDGGAALLCPIQGEKDYWIHVGVASWKQSLPIVFSSISKSIPWIETMLANFNPRLDHLKY